MKKKNPIISACFFGAFVAMLFIIKYGLLIGLTAMIAAGLLFCAGIYFFANSKTVKEQTQIDGDDSIVLAGPANHFLNNEGVGGKLYLLNDKIHFKSHRFNVQNHEFKIDLSMIKEVKLYNVLGIIPNGMEIQTTTGNKEKFVVNNRDKWKMAIAGTVAQL
jgi:hypothetical protein